MVAETSVRLEAFKHAIEKSTRKRASDHQRRKLMLGRLKHELSHVPETKQATAIRKFSAEQDQYMRECRKRVAVADFEFLKVIGTGTFGIVRLCRKKEDGSIFALKQIRKEDVVDHAHYIRAEKDALSTAQHDGIVKLHCSFQDDTFLYLLMDYLPGGDLMTHLQRMTTFNEAETRFYIAELVDAIDYIHTRLQYVHRDIKPDNIVFDARGHIHLIDFGVSMHSATAGPREGGATPRQRAVIGTPDYAGPEVYGGSDGSSGRSIGTEYDWWSVGIIMFEMLFGAPPFSDELHDPAVTRMRVTRWRQYFHMPPDAQVGDSARQCIQGLICDPEDRLTANGIRAHPFFRGLDFGKLWSMAPPIKPKVSGLADTSNFDDFGTGVDYTHYDVTQAQQRVANDPRHFAFHDFGYRRDLEGRAESTTAAAARGRTSGRARTASSASRGTWPR
mmetsp:Transcript_71904/g.203045  ORF Transcript_71904/g.203045 Transcript_71904/m.203045 type:complete len:446 (-) Transcript_71904:1658-2995(-)